MTIGSTKKHKKITITLPTKTISELRIIAKREDRPMSRIVDRALRKYYELHYKKRIDRYQPGSR